METFAYHEGVTCIKRAGHDATLETHIDTENATKIVKGIRGKKHPEKLPPSREHRYVTGAGFGVSEEHRDAPHLSDKSTGGRTRERRDYVAHYGKDDKKHKHEHIHGGDYGEETYDKNPRADGSAPFDCMSYIGVSETKYVHRFARLAALGGNMSSSINIHRPPSIDASIAKRESRPDREKAKDGATDKATVLLVIVEAMSLSG